MPSGFAVLLLSLLFALSLKIDFRVSLQLAVETNGVGWYNKKITQLLTRYAVFSFKAHGLRGKIEKFLCKRENNVETNSDPDHAGWQYPSENHSYQGETVLEGDQAV